MRDGQDRNLLADWLDSLGRYSVQTVDVDDPLPSEYDLCLLDRDALDRFQTDLLAHDDSSGSVFLPHVLVAPATVADDIRQRLDDDLDALLDDVLPVPMGKSLLRRRLENLLRARRSSVGLAERERQYRKLVELTPETILLVDDGRVRYANAAAEALLDLDDPSDLEGQRLVSFVAPEDVTDFRQFMSGVGDSDGGTGAEFVDLSFESTTGRSLSVAVAGVPVIYDGQSMTQLLVRDLTTERRRKQRLNLFGRAMEAAAQGITIADAAQEDNPLIYANQGFQRITGYPMAEILGRNCRFLQGENTDQATVERLRAAIDAKSPVSVDILNYRKDGTPFWNRLDIVPVEDEDGDVTHFLGLQRDITDQKEREQQLSVLNRVLRHNLRNKMNIVQVYAAQMQDATALDEAAEAGTSIRQAADELLALSEQIRKFDSIVAADERDLEQLDLVTIVREGLGSDGGKRDAAVDLSLPETAPILGHETLTPALTDLLGLTERADDLHLAIDVTVEDTAVVLTVTDRGDTFSRTDLEIVANEVETPLEHLQRLELWLLRWAVEESHGEFTVDAAGENPSLTMRFRRADDRE